MKGNLLLILVKIPFLGNYLLDIIAKLENGQMESNFLRMITKKRYKVSVGLYSYGYCFSNKFNLGGEVLIGRYCSIAEGVRYFAADHPINSLSTSPLFYNESFGYSVKDVDRSKLNIANDVWIGCNVMILSKCKYIGNGAVIGAGSIVTHDIQPYSIVAGNPAKVIGYRFSESERALIENSKWWEKKPNELIKYYDHFEDPKKLIRKMGHNKAYE